MPSIYGAELGWAGLSECRVSAYAAGVDGGSIDTLDTAAGARNKNHFPVARYTRPLVGDGRYPKVLCYVYLEGRATEVAVPLLGDDIRVCRAFGMLD